MSSLLLEVTACNLLEVTTTLFYYLLRDFLDQRLLFSIWASILSLAYSTLAVTTPSLSRSLFLDMPFVSAAKKKKLFGLTTVISFVTIFFVGFSIYNLFLSWTSFLTFSPNLLLLVPFPFV